MLLESTLVYFFFFIARLITQTIAPKYPTRLERQVGFIRDIYLAMVPLYYINYYLQKH